MLYPGVLGQLVGGQADDWQVGYEVTLDANAPTNRTRTMPGIPLSAHPSHEVVLPVLGAVLVARRSHVLLGEELVVGVVLLPLLFLPLLCLPSLFFSLWRGEGEKQSASGVRERQAAI